jgi:hypothetical protein
MNTGERKMKKKGIKKDTKIIIFFTFYIIALVVVTLIALSLTL